MGKKYKIGPHISHQLKFNLVALINKWGDGKIFMGKKINLDLYATQEYIKINSKWITNPNIKAKTIKFIEANIGEYLHNMRKLIFLKKTKSTVFKRKTNMKDTSAKIKYL